MINKHYPKFEKRLDQDLSKREMGNLGGREGIIIAYNSFKNTATVMLSDPKTDTPGEIIQNVKCPTYLGLQMAAPDPGRYCYVQFKRGGFKNPIITHFYNENYTDYDYEAQTKVRTWTPNFYSSI